MWEVRTVVSRSCRSVRQSRPPSTTGSAITNNRMTSRWCWPGRGKSSRQKLNLLLLPSPLLEQHCACRSHRGLSDRNGKESSVRFHVQRNSQPISQWYLEQPEAKKINDGGSDRVARPIEGLHHHHEVGIAEISIAHDAQAGRSQRHNFGIMG